MYEYTCEYVVTCNITHRMRLHIESEGKEWNMMMVFRWQIMTPNQVSVESSRDELRITT